MIFFEYQIGHFSKLYYFCTEKCSLTTYLKQATSTQQTHYTMQTNLTHEEEMQLGMRIAQGDERALERLVTANLGFVVSLARKYQINGVALDDLISEGNIAMMLAARKWDASKGEPFIKYAVWDIRRAIAQEVAKQSSVVSTPQLEQKKKSTIIKTKKQLEQKHQDTVSDYDVADEMGIKVKRVGETMRATRSQLSMDAPIFSGVSDTVGSKFPSRNDKSASELADISFFEDEISDALSVLNERERKVICLYYGIKGDSYTMMEIAEMMDLKRERVRQIRKKAERKLRIPMKALR